MSHCTLNYIELPLVVNLEVTEQIQTFTHLDRGPYRLLQRVVFPEALGEVEVFIQMNGLRHSMGRTTLGVLTFPSPESEKLTSWQSTKMLENGFLTGLPLNRTQGAVSFQLHLRDRYGGVGLERIPVLLIFANVLKRYKDTQDTGTNYLIEYHE